MDVSRVCGIFSHKLWHNDDTTTLVRWYRTPNNAPIFPHLHLFTRSCWLPEKDMPNPGNGKVGELQQMVAYDKGALPVNYFLSDRFCGDVRIYQDGGDITLDPPIEFAGEQSVCCLSFSDFGLGNLCQCHVITSQSVSEDIYEGNVCQCHIITNEDTATGAFVGEGCQCKTIISFSSINPIKASTVCQCLDITGFSTDGGVVESTAIFGQLIGGYKLTNVLKVSQSSQGQINSNTFTGHGDFTADGCQCHDISHEYNNNSPDQENNSTVCQCFTISGEIPGGGPPIDTPCCDAVPQTLRCLATMAGSPYTDCSCADGVETDLIYNGTDAWEGTLDFTGCGTELNIKFRCYDLGGVWLIDTTGCLTTTQGGGSGTACIPVDWTFPAMTAPTCCGTFGGGIIIRVFEP